MAKDRINAAAVSSENAAKQGRPIEFEKLIWIMAAVFKQNNKASISPKVIAAMSGQKWSEHAIQHYFREVNRQAKALADEVSEGNNGTDVTTPTKSTTGAVGGAGENKKKRKGAGKSDVSAYASPEDDELEQAKVPKKQKKRAEPKIKSEDEV